MNMRTLCTLFPCGLCKYTSANKIQTYVIVYIAITHSSLAYPRRCRLPQFPYCTGASRNTPPSVSICEISVQNEFCFATANRAQIPRRYPIAYQVAWLSLRCRSHSESRSVSIAMRATCEYRSHQVTAP